MSKPKSAAAKSRVGSNGVPAVPPPGEPAADALSRHMPSAAAIRETVESIVIAFVLAFLFRTFEAEAFVIPTGSMAPTLMGRHKDVVCPKCDYSYQVSASDEADSDGALKGLQHQTVSGTCPMCRYTADLASLGSYNGDRILVEKFAYESSDPKRWDVVVFKFPGDSPMMPANHRSDARTNFIKRLVGLPGETIRIQNGDLWVRRGDEPFHIARKPPKKLLAMLQPVFDNDYMPRIAKDGWPPRWQPEPAADGSAAGAWSSDDHVTFHTDGTAADERWLRYRHLVPSFDEWRDHKSSPQDQLVTDFMAYNTGQSRSSNNMAPDAESLGAHWVGDLALRCTAEIQSEKGQLIFELRKGGRQFQARLDVASGKATLFVSGQDMADFRPTAQTAVSGPGCHEIIFANCDNELQLWVDGNVVQFDAPTAYDDLGNTRPDPSDLMPASVGSTGAEVRIGHLRLLCDIYYGAQRGMGMPSEKCDVEYESGQALPGKGRLPVGANYVDFTLRPDQFFMLGDNSARSKDGRLWGPDNHWVDRELLIGKALFVYWPHSWDKIPYVNIPLPFFPNFARMRLVR